MLVPSDARSEGGDLLRSEVVRRAGIGVGAYGGSVIVRALRWELGAIQCGCWIESTV